MGKRFLERRYILRVQMLLKNLQNLNFASRLPGVLDAQEPSFENIREFRLKRRSLNTPQNTIDPYG